MPEKPRLVDAQPGRLKIDMAVDVALIECSAAAAPDSNCDQSKQPVLVEDVALPAQSSNAQLRGLVWIHSSSMSAQF